MKILVINGPNLNMLGIRNPAVYGTETYRDLVRKVKVYGKEKRISVRFFQSNHEGKLIDAIQMAYGRYDGVILNPGAYTHTSIALADALEAVGIPAVEVHISDVTKREEFRQISFVRPYCIGTVTGIGLDGYCEAVDILVQYNNDKKTIA